MQEGDITLYDDLIKEVSKDLNIDERQVKEVCDLSIRYIKNLASEKETMGISLPHLGTLFYSESLGSFYRDRYKNKRGKLRESQQKEIENAEYRHNVLNEALKHQKKSRMKHFYRPFLYKFKRVLKKMDIPLPRGGVTLNRKDLWEKVGDIQNEKLNG